MGFAATGGPPSRPSIAVPRRTRALAALIDLATLALLCFLASAAAIAWLLLRTSGGAVDASDEDTAIAFALAGAVPPVWLAGLARGLLRHRATPGERALGLRVEGARREGRRALVLRLLVHPWGAIGWLWLAGVAWLAGIGWIAWPLTMLALVIMVVGLVSAALWLVRPDATPMHDRLAGTRLVRA